MTKYFCHCGFSAPMRESEFPFNCPCGTKYETADDMRHGNGSIVLPPSPLPMAEIERRIAICKSGCEHWNSQKEGCNVCGTCGSGQKMFNGLISDPRKICPHPKGNRWGDPLPPPIKVAFYSPGLKMGGAERWIASLCNHFDVSKIHVAAVVVSDPKNASVESTKWFPRYTRVLLGYDYLTAVLKQVDLLISWGPVCLDAMTKGARIPIIDVAHGTLGHWGGCDRDGFKVQELIAQEAIKAGAHLAAVNEECFLNYPEDVRERVTIIPNGAEVERVKSDLSKEEAKAKFGISECQKVVLFVGRFAREKNLQALVDAMEFLPGWTLLAIGPKYNPPLRVEGKMIVTPGIVDPPGDAYRAADVLCMPSFHEAHSLTLIEGNLAGIPVVSFDYPAMKHLTAKHGPLAWLLPTTCTSEDLAKEILVADTFQDSERVKRIQKISLEIYTAEAMAERWQEYLCGIYAASKRA